MDIKYIGNIGPASGEGGGSSDGADTSLSNLTNTGKIQVAHLAMPSDTVTELTVSAETFYTAPADGYITAWAATGYTLQVIVLKSTATDTSVENRVVESCLNVGQDNSAIRTFVPIKKGQKFTIYRYGSVAIRAFFTYAEGSKSEAN